MVEHPFQILKNKFHFRKVRYKGITKNLNTLYILFASTNLLMIKQGEINGAKLRKVRARG
jgi:IS5 family transposase